MSELSAWVDLRIDKQKPPERSGGLSCGVVEAVLESGFPITSQLCDPERI